MNLRLCPRASSNQPTIGYVAFFNDIEHEVAPVASGHRITLTYNLYFDDGGPFSENDAVYKHLNPPEVPNRGGSFEAFKALLGNPELMAGGGTLAFWLRHVYPIDDNLKKRIQCSEGKRRGRVPGCACARV